MSEEEKDGEYYAEGSFVAKEVTKKIKELKQDPSPEAVSLREKLTSVEKRMKEEKNLKAQIKKDTAALHARTKETIENLTDDQVRELLEKKWIESLTKNLFRLPGGIVDGLVKKLEELGKKYETTYSELEQEIRETEQLLASMIDELEGSEFDRKGLGEFQSLLRGE